LPREKIKEPKGSYIHACNVSPLLRMTPWYQ
jgi:hypothetical protein